MSQSALWTFYGRQGCDCCQAAASLLLRVLDNRPITLRMVDVAAYGPREGPDSIPALVDPRGKVVWEGSFDSEATRMALEVWGVADRHGDWHASAVTA